MSAEFRGNGENRREWRICGVLFVGAFLVRLIRLFYLDVWLDEANLLVLVQMSFAEIWHFCKGENFPPLYPWLLKLWSLFSASDNWMRLSSAVSGAAVVPVAYLLGQELNGKRLGLLLGLACTISVPLLYYSQMIRMYSLFVLFACLSYYNFLRALRTGAWKYWIFMALANLAGFYTFLFMVFPIFSQILVLIHFYRRDLKRYIRPLLAHLPALGLMSLWIAAMLTRYQVLQTYYTVPMSLDDVARLWVFLGMGYGRAAHIPWLLITNLPLLLGVLLGVPQWKQNPGILALALVGGLSLMAIVVFSLKYSIFFERYMLFLLPIYFILVFIGWSNTSSRLAKGVGIAMVFGALLIAQGFYWSHYQEAQDHFRYSYRRPQDDDGRSMSRMAALVRERLAPQEAIIHYSEKHRNNLSFFCFAYYHKRAVPEFVYSQYGIPQYAGQQYLRPGELIKSLQDLPQLPTGIWVITLNAPYIILEGSQASREAQWVTAEEGDLHGELRDYGYVLQDTLRDGAVHTLYFRRPDGQSSGQILKGE